MIVLRFVMVLMCDRFTDLSAVGCEGESKRQRHLLQPLLKEVMLRKSLNIARSISADRGVKISAIRKSEPLILPLNYK